MTSEYLNAVIAEGSAEMAIIDVLLEKNALIFARDDLLEEEVLRVRNGKSFARKHLNKAMDKKVKIYRILDSPRENFNLPKAYEKKVVLPVNNIYTQPEIEVLYILYHDDFNKYKRSKLTPSIFVKKTYKDLDRVKAYNDVYDFWNAHFEELISVLHKHKGMNSSHYTIYDLVKSELKK